ncbi:MAG: DegT/DnrJ/EryC1/StrS family aminotransferase [Calditrichaeota bacterium]|nr:MAG: DegT/DnrJ/EryC1/StrS family aminotransferase [Calditrichota bacterium]
MPKLALLGGKSVRKQKFLRWPLVEKEERAALLRTFDSSVWGIGGEDVIRFQEAFARLHQANHGIAVMNGTVSLGIALKAARVGEGDEVIIPAYTFVATATAVLSANAIPIFVDIDPNTYCIDPQRIREAITPRTRAIIPVHMAGHPADMDAIMDLAQEYQLWVIEDAAHAVFAEWQGKKVGGLGHFGSFSFQSSKNLSSGEGGIVLTQDSELADRCWSYHNCGRRKGGEWYHHPYLGSNYRMTEFQAAILLAQIPRALKQMDLRQENARYLGKKLSALPGITPLQSDPRVGKHGYHLYVLKYHKEQFDGLSRSDFLSALIAEGIPASRGYVPLYREGFLEEARQFYLRNPAYNSYDYSKVFLPETEKACEESIWLPHYLLLGNKSDLDDIVKAFEKVIVNYKELLATSGRSTAQEDGIIFGEA